MRVAKKKKPIKPGRIVAYSVLLLHTFITLYPIYIMIITSLKKNKDIFKHPFALPKTLDFASYTKVLELNNFPQYFLNSIIVTLVSTAIFVVVSVLAAYAISRFKFKGNNIIYIYFLLGMMVPIRLGIINMFELFDVLHLKDNLLGLIAIYSAMSIGFSVFILTGFMRTIPRELEEAAKIDGCSQLRVLWNVIIPILKPAIATAIVYNFVPIWNDFYFPLVFIKTENLKTLPIGVAIFFGQYQTDWSTVFAALTLAAVPVLIFYFTMSKEFIKGLTAGAIKE